MGLKTPTWPELSRAQTRLKEVLADVIEDGKVRVINGHDDKPVAVLVPYAHYRELRANYDPGLD